MKYIFDNIDSNNSNDNDNDNDNNNNTAPVTNLKMR